MAGRKRPHSTYILSFYRFYYNVLLETCSHLSNLSPRLVIAGLYEPTCGEEKPVTQHEPHAPIVSPIVQSCITIGPPTYTFMYLIIIYGYGNETLLARGLQTLL